MTNYSINTAWYDEIKHLAIFENAHIVAEGPFSGQVEVDVNGEKINIVTVHTYPFKYTYLAEDQKASAAENGGDVFRAAEMKYICEQTILGQDPQGKGNWMMLGDFNAVSRGNHSTLHTEKGFKKIIRLEMLHVKECLAEEKLRVARKVILAYAGKLAARVHLIPRDLIQDNRWTHRLKVVGIAKTRYHLFIFFRANKRHVLFGKLPHDSFILIFHKKYKKGIIKKCDGDKLTIYFEDSRRTFVFSKSYCIGNHILEF